MEKIVVRGGRKLAGTVKVEGAKNAVLKTLVATLLASEGKIRPSKRTTFSRRLYNQ